MLSLEKLHAKIYVFDKRQGLVTSANATYSGFHKNAECGIAVDDASIAEKLSLLIRSGFGILPAPSSWNEQQLLTLAPAIEMLKQRIPEVLKSRVRQGEEEGNLELTHADAETLLAATAGWTQLVFKNLAKVPEEFELNEIYAACRNDSLRDYPLRSL